MTGPISLGPKPGIPARAVAEQVGDEGFTGPLAASELDVAAAAHGDRVAFAAIYDRYSARLYDFAAGMLRDRDAAADCVQDTFCIAATRLGQLREPDKLRPWLYSITRHEALRRIKTRRREQVVDEVPEHAGDDHDGPEALAARGELATLIADAADGLSDRDRTVLELHYRHGLDGPELADALGVSHTNANTLVGRLRTTIDRSLGALLVARHARRHPGHCPQLDTVLDGWDGQLTVLMRKRIARHLEQCVPCQGQRAQMVNPRALLGTVPAILPAPLWLRAHTLHHAGAALPAAAGHGLAGAAAGTHAAHAASTGSAGLASAHPAAWWPRGMHRLPRPRASHLAGLGGVGAVGAAVTTVVVLTGHPTPVSAPDPVAPIAAATPAALPARPGTVVQHSTVTATQPPSAAPTAPGSTITQVVPPVSITGAPVTVTAPPVTTTAPGITRFVPGPVRTTTVTRTVPCTDGDCPTAPKPKPKPKPTPK